MTEYDETDDLDRTNRSRNDSVCGICSRRPGKEVSIGDEDGATVAYACETCLARLVEGDDCAICQGAASGEYQIILTATDWRQNPLPVCSECRKRWVFDNPEPLCLRLARLGVYRFVAGGGREYDEHGNPIPRPRDECEVCGVRREDRPEGFAPEILPPFEGAEYLCKRCREAGRGMK